MTALFFNIRFYVLLFSFFLSIVVYFWISSIQQGGYIYSLVVWYAYLAIAFLYLALLAGPLTKVLQHLPLRASFIKARRALGVSAFYFASLHAWNAFFNYLGGFEVLPFLDPLYQVALLLSSIALFILSVMAVTSFDYMVKKLTFPIWKKIHQFVYLASLFIVIHVVLVGSTFTNSFTVKIIFLVGVVFLVGLHVVGLWKKYNLEHPQSQKTL